MCRSRRELSNAYFLAKFRFDTAENEACKVCPIEQCSSLRPDVRVECRLDGALLDHGAAHVRPAVQAGPEDAREEAAQDVLFRGLGCRKGLELTSLNFRTFTAP